MLAAAHAFSSNATYNWVWILIGLITLAGLGLAAMRWANNHIARPLKIVTGEPETDDDPGKPSLYRLTKNAAESAAEAKATGERALEVGKEALKVAQLAARDIAEVRRQTKPTNGKTLATLTEETSAKISAIEQRPQ